MLRMELEEADGKQEEEQQQQEHEQEEEEEEDPEVSALSSRLARARQPAAGRLHPPKSPPPLVGFSRRREEPAPEPEPEPQPQLVLEPEPEPERATRRLQPVLLMRPTVSTQRSPPLEMDTESESDSD